MQKELALSARFRSSPNIAWVKYWGKYNQDYILPINDSLGLTLDADDLCTITTISFGTAIVKDQLLLNGEQHPISKRVANMFRKIRVLAYETVYREKVSTQIWERCYFRVQSLNSFPTASGMASSASGLACLAGSLNGLFDNFMTQEELSQLARLGSGSASRSVHGGLVRWSGVPNEVYENRQKQLASQQQLQKLSKICISRTVYPAPKLHYLRVMILLANNHQKQVSSTTGMNQSVQTSTLITQRNKIARTRVQTILACLHQLQLHPGDTHSFNTLTRTIIQDSNQFHAICLDTYPPIFYLNAFSQQIIHIVDHVLNPGLEYKIGYSFDAGPHAFLFMHESVEARVLAYWHRLFGMEQGQYNARAWAKLQGQGEQAGFGEYKGEMVKPYQIWCAGVGEGTQRMES